MRAELRHRARAVLRAAWALLRRASGDDAYERYLEHAHHVHPGRQPLSRAGFERERQERRWQSASRCC
jgi:uncharacterized short protein YbdD (DUF466 family)